MTRFLLFLQRISILIFISSVGLTSMPERDYRDALQLVDKRIQSRKHLQGNASSLSASTIKTLYGRFYQVGDSWNVASWNLKNSQMRKTDAPHDLQKRYSETALFHYEVIQVRPGTDAEVDLRITQVQKNQFKIVDPRVSNFILTLRVTPQGQLVQAHKRYSFLNRSIRANNQSPLELYPLDIPETQGADLLTHPSAPEFPAELQERIEEIGFQPALSHCSEFEQDDFFGRAVHILWQHGDPWPLYLRTSGGISILIKKGDV